MKKILLISAVLLVTWAVQAQEVQTNPRVNTTHSEVITKQGTKFYLGEYELSHRDLKGLMRNTSPHLYKQYQTGYNLIGAGWYFTASSAAALIAWGGVCIGDLYATPSTIHCHPNGGFWAGLICAPIGGAFALVGIPMLCVGYEKRNKSINAYNILHKQAPAVTCNFTASENGIGFAVHF